VLYHNAAGILFMTVCLAVYLAAFLLSEKILQIRM
jgi:tight adherence protein B